jgi:hypothetical protein
VTEKKAEGGSLAELQRRGRAALHREGRATRRLECQAVSDFSAKERGGLGDSEEWSRKGSFCGKGRRIDRFRGGLHCGS